MMIKNKVAIKTVSVCLMASLLTPSVVVATDSLDDILVSTSTSAGSWSDPLGGGTYISGGDFKIKFKGASQYAPLLDFKLPSAKVGCSGISISGGFLSYLGLDKLQNQLSDAGASLMFGIILGMEFTLPAVSATFNKIRAWANALQGLLQNGCNIGRAIAKSSGLAKKFHTEELSKAIEGPFNEMNDFIDGGDEVLKELQKLADCSGNLNDPNCKKLASAVVALGSEVKENKDDNTAKGLTATLYEKSAALGRDSKAVAVGVDLADFYENKSIGCSRIAHNTAIDNDIFIDKLKYIFFGDIGADDDSVSAWYNSLDNDNCVIDNGALSLYLGNALTTGGNSDFPRPSFSPIAPLIKTPEDAAKALMGGFDELDGKYADITNNTINIPNRKVVYLDLPQGLTEDKLPTSRVRAVYVSSAAASGKLTPVSWHGAFLESLKGIRGVVDAQTKSSWRIATTYDRYDTSGVTTIKAPLLVPGVKKYANVISKMEKKAKGETRQTYELKVQLAKINAIYFSRALIDGIESRVGELSERLNGNSEIINNYLAYVRSVSREVGKILKELEKDVYNNDLIKNFKELEKEQKLDSIKATR